MKLPKGQQNIPFVRCKPGYAEGTNKPKRERKVIQFNPLDKAILRKAA